LVFGVFHGDKTLPVELETGVVSPLETDGRQFQVCDLPTADRPGAVGRADNDAIPEREYLPMEGVVKSPCCPFCFLWPEEVSPPHVTCKEGVPREDDQGVARDGEIAHDEGYALAGVAGRLEDCQFQAPDAKPVGL